EDPGCEPRIVPKDLAEPSELQERHVAQDEQRPLASQPLHALPDGVGLVRQERIDPPLVFLRSSPPSSHYPFGPCQTYILSIGYQLARPRERRRWHGRRPQRTRIGTDRWRSRSSRARNPPCSGTSWRKSSAGGSSPSSSRWASTSRSARQAAVKGESDRRRRRSSRGARATCASTTSTRRERKSSGRVARSSSRAWTSRAWGVSSGSARPAARSSRPGRTPPRCRRSVSEWRMRKRL